MKNYTKIMDFNGTPCIEISAGGFTAYIAYEIGSNVIRLRDEKNGIEIFRFKADTPADEIKKSAEVWGLPTLYLPNRFADGILKTSDAVYHLPVNEKAPYNNHIHGFIHKRKHTVAEHSCNDKKAWAKTQYIYDENDEFFEYLPVKFKAEYTFEVSENGLEYKVEFTNLSDKMMPVSVATHTTINTPFADGAEEKDIRAVFGIGKKCELNERCLPTEKLLELNEWDMAYKNGTQCPVLQDISNDMYFMENTELDGKPFHGAVFTDTASGKKICYEVSDAYKFWIIWNDRGFNKYFCPEPMTAMIDAPNLSLPADITGYTEIAPNEKYECRQHFFTK